MLDKDYKILTVDDSPMIRKMIRIKFQKNTEFQTFFAEDGKDALDFLSHNEVNLIITDLEMPKMDGLTLLKKMKFKNPLISIIVISAFDSLKNVEAVYKSLALKFYPKPIDFESLIFTAKKCKLEFEELTKEKNLFNEMNFIFETKLFKTQLKNYKLIINKIVRASSQIFISNENKSTEIFIILSDWFLFIRNVLYNKINENYLYFVFKQKPTGITLEFKFDDYNLEDLLKTNNEALFLELKNKYESISFENNNIIIMKFFDAI